MKIHLKRNIWERDQTNMNAQFHSILKRSSRSALTNGKVNGIRVLYNKEIIFEEK